MALYSSSKVVSACGRSCFSTEGDLGLHLGLQHAAKRHLGVVAVAHVGKQGAEVRLIDAQLLLHFGMGQAHLAAHHPPAMGHVVLDVQTLDGIGGVGIVDAENITQRGDRPGRSVPRRAAAGPARQEKKVIIYSLSPCEEIEHQLIKTVGMFPLRPVAAVAVNMQFRTGDPGEQAQPGVHRHEAVIASPDDQSWRADFAQPRAKVRKLLRVGFRGS